MGLTQKSTDHFTDDPRDCHATPDTYRVTLSMTGGLEHNTPEM